MILLYQIISRCHQMAAMPPSSADKVCHSGGQTAPQEHLQVTPVPLFARNEHPGRTHRKQGYARYYAGG